jgi:hypothetical protein
MTYSNNPNRGQRDPDVGRGSFIWLVAMVAICAVVGLIYGLSSNRDTQNAYWSRNHDALQHTSMRS